MACIEGAKEPCYVCGTNAEHPNMCKSCGRSYDRMLKTKSETIESVIRWAANRARKAERARNRSK